MRRGIAVSWHALSFLLAAVLYFIFVLPRWWELMGDVPHGVGTTMRIVTGALIGLTALPVVFNLIRTRRPEYGTPQLALTIRVWSIVGQILAGVLIVGAAIAEIWLNLDDAGQWLFGVYGAAAALAVLGAAAFYLAFVAELPPPPPKPLKPKPTAKTAEPEPAVQADDVPVEVVVDEPATESAEDETAKEDAENTAGGRLRNRRPSGKAGGVNANRRRGAGGVAVSDD
jgi:hypothetical protein